MFWLWWYFSQIWPSHPKSNRPCRWSYGGCKTLADWMRKSLTTRNRCCRHSSRVRSVTSQPLAERGKLCFFCLSHSDHLSSDSYNNFLCDVLLSALSHRWSGALSSTLSWWSVRRSRSGWPTTWRTSRCSFVKLNKVPHDRACMSATS